MDGSRDPDLPDPGDGFLGEPDLLGRALERWAADATVDEAASARVRARWLRVQTEDESSLIGTLVDLAERARPVVLDVGDHRLRGTLVGIGADFLAAHTDQGQHVLVTLGAIDAVRAEPGGVEVVGDRTPLVNVSLAGVLGPIAADRPTVLVRTSGGVAVRGELRSAGRDVVRIRVEGDPPTPTWVPRTAIALMVLEP